MTHIHQIEGFCNDMLEAGRFDDASFNGIQVETARPISVIATGVTASEALIAEAVRAGAQLVLAHHGIFWSGQSPVLRGGMRKRIKLLMDHEMGLIAYHLPLDAHPGLGNNAALGNRLGLTAARPWGKYHGTEIGMAGILAPQSADEIVRSLSKMLEREVLHFPGEHSSIEKVAIVSGGAANMALDAARDGFHLFLTGEPTETCMHIAAEEGIHIVAAGHHATETMGIKALGDNLAQRFKLRAIHLDLPNPV